MKKIGTPGIFVYARKKGTEAFAPAFYYQSYGASGEPAIRIMGTVSFQPASEFEIKRAEN